MEDEWDWLDDGEPTLAWEPTAARKAAMFFGIYEEGTDQEDFWVAMGWCDALHASGRDCGYDDGTPECKKQQARNRPCEFRMGRSRSLHWMRSNEPEGSWTDRWGDRPECPPDAKDTWKLKCVPRGFIGERLLWRPEWVPADQPTPYEDSHGYWMKLRLEVAASELSPPPRVRVRRSSHSADATAWDPARIPAFAGQALAAIEAGVRRVAAELLGRRAENDLFSRLNITGTLSTR
jgi:hypothetical protein